MSKSIKSARKPRAYTGELAERIYIPIVAADTAGDSSNRKLAELEAEATYRKITKFPELFEFYKIVSPDQHQWFRLALALAERHVPGFRVVYGARPKPGRRRSWKAGLANDLARDVDSLTSDGNMTIEKAIVQLHADPSKNWRRYTVPNLLTREREARRAIKERHRLVSELANSGLIAGFGPSPSPKPKSGLIAGVTAIPKTDENK